MRSKKGSIETDNAEAITDLQLENIRSIKSGPELINEVARQVAAFEAGGRPISEEVISAAISQVSAFSQAAGINNEDTLRALTFIMRM